MVETLKEKKKQIRQQLKLQLVQPQGPKYAY